MEILEMISEWEKGCSCAGPMFDEMRGNPPGTTSPSECSECTEGLLHAIKQHEITKTFSGCLTPRFDLVVQRLEKASDDERGILRTNTRRVVEALDLQSLLHEFYRIDGLYRRLMAKNETPDIKFNGEENHSVT